MKTQIPGTMGLEFWVPLAGILAGTARSIVEAPTEYAKVRRQTSSSWKMSEITTGFGSTWVWATGMMTTYFCLVDRVRTHTNLWNSSLGQFFGSGSCACFGFFITWPFEIIKNQEQAETDTTIKQTWGQRVRHMIEVYGVWGLWRGYIPGAMSVFMRNGLAMVVMQAAQKKLTEMGFWD